MDRYKYLGDSVYAYFDGCIIWLRTGNHDEAFCDQEIGIEPEVLRSLNKFNQRIQEEFKAMKIKEES